MRQNARRNDLDNKPLRFFLQGINYALFMALVWYFSSALPVRIIGDDQSVLTIAFAHAGQLREPCRKLSQEELNRLAPNMRKLEDCPRERSPVTIEAALDGEALYQATLQPPGLFGDGGVDVFFSARVPVGERMLSLKMNDSIRVHGFNYHLEQLVRFDPARVLLVGFDARKGFEVHSAD